MPKTADRNYLLRGVPVEVDTTLNTLATLRGVRKWEIVLEAMVEYAKNHKGDVKRLAETRMKPSKIESGDAI